MVQWWEELGEEDQCLTPWPLGTRQSGPEQGGEVGGWGC